MRVGALHPRCRYLMETTALTPPTSLLPVALQHVFQGLNPAFSL